jgi:rare lipoprotein A
MWIVSFFQLWSYAMRPHQMFSLIPPLLASLIGILGPLFCNVHEDRSKDISVVQEIIPTETPRQDSSCNLTYHPYQRGTASWYGPGFHGRKMANGMPYNMKAYTVAHPTLRLGTEVCITNRANGRSIKATVTDRGPYVHPRIVDLSKRIADELDITERGLGNVVIGLRHRPTPV